MKMQFRKSFVIIVTMEYQNVQASVNFSHMIKGPGMLPGLCNRPFLVDSSQGTPCNIGAIKHKIAELHMKVRHTFKYLAA
jgi:hypothetical protein